MKGRWPRNMFWCSGCDCCLVAPGKKCRECGRKERKRDAVKPNTDAILKTSAEETE